jgi:hypothetical protein
MNSCAIFLKPRVCLVAASLITRIAYGGDFLFDNSTTDVYPADWAIDTNWNPNALPNGPLDNVVFSNVAGGMNTNPAALTNFQLNNFATSTINQLRFTSAPANATAFNMQAASAQTLTLNQIIVSGNIPNPPSVGGAAANNGPWQVQPNISLNAAVDPLYNSTGQLRVINTAGSGLQLQGQITTGPGGFVKDGTGSVRFGTSGATFTNSIAGDILVNNGTLQASNGASGNVLGGSGKVIMNGPGTVLQLNADTSTNYGRDVVVNANTALTTDRSGASAISQVTTLGNITIGANDKYLTLTSANSYSYAFAGLNLGANTLNLRNGLNNTANTDATGHAVMGAVTGSGTINMSGAGGNSTVGLTFNTASPAFTGKLNLFEGASHIVSTTGALGSASVVLGEPSNTLPITYPNIAIGSSGSPLILSNPWSALLKYNANNPTTGSVTVNGASQVNMGVVPNASDVITLGRFGIIQGSTTELAGFTVGTNLILPASDAVIARETPGSANPLSLPLTASHYYGAAANLNGPVTVGAGTPWKGVSNDRFARAIGGGATTLTVNGGDNNPATSEVSLAGLNQTVLTLLNTAGDTFASATGQKFTIGIDGYGSAFNGLGAGASPGGTVLIGRAAGANGLATNVDAINVNSGNFQVNAAGALGGVPVNINNNAGLDIAGTIGNALDSVITVNSGGTLVLNDPTVLTAAATNTVTINSGGRLHITGATTPANILTASTQPITFSGTGHTVRVSIDDVSGLDAAVPNTGAVWEIASTGTNNNAVNLWGTTFAVNIGRLVLQSAGLSTDGGVITTDNGTRFLDASLTIGTAGATIAASTGPNATGSSLVLRDTATATGVSIGGGTSPVQIGSLTPINGLTKTHNPLAAQNNDAVYENTHNASPQVIFTNGLKAGNVNLVSGSLLLDGPDTNTKITGDINMGAGTRLYLGDGGNIASGNGFGVDATRRGDLTPLLIAGTVATGAINVAHNSRVEMGLDQTDPALAASLVNGRAQVSQAFAVAAGADLMDTDRRNLWVNRSAGTTALLVDLNNITLGANSNLSIQESNTDVRASIKLLGNATVAGFAGGAGCFDLKDVSGAGTLTIGRLDMPFSAVGLYGSISATVPVNNLYGRFEIRDTATIPAGFTFTDNAVNARALQSDQNAAPTGVNGGSDHTLSIWKGQTGAPGTNLTTGSFLMNAANNAAGLYVDDSSGQPIINDIQTGITLAADGQVVFSARGNTDAAVNGIVRIKDVTIAAPVSTATLATRDLTDLEVTNLNILGSAVVKVPGARTDGRGAVRIGNVNVETSVHFQDGRATITGNVDVDNDLTVGGTSLEFNPGVAGTSTVNAGFLKVNTMLAAKSGTVTILTNITSPAPGTLVPGLREGVILGNAGNMTAPNPADNAATANLYDNTNPGIRLDPRAGTNNSTDDNATITHDTARGWSRNQTWVYSGEIYDADGVFTLAENIDDNTQIKIDGVIVQASNGILVGGTGGGLQAPFNVWTTVTNTATKDGFGSLTQAITGAGDIGSGLANTLAMNLNPSGGITNFGMGAAADGWHTIEIRIGNGAGGAGPTVANGWGNYLGLGIRANGGSSLIGSDYDKPVDKGTMNLFRTTTVAKGNVDVDNGATVTAPSLKTIGLLTFGRNGLGSSPTLSLTAAAVSDVEKVEVAAASDVVNLLVVPATGRLNTKQLNLSEGKILVVNPGGAGRLDIAEGSGTSANANANLLLKGGILSVNNPSGSATGDALVSIDAGTLTGNGSISGLVTVAAGATLAPGQNAGLLTLGNTTLQNGANIDWEVTDWTGPAGTGYDTLATSALTLSPAAGVINLRIKQSALTNFTNATRSFTLATSSSTITNFTPAQVIITSTGFTAGSGTWSTAQVGSDIILTYTASIGTTPYQDWTALNNLGALSGINDDPDGDGKANLIEFALNSNPASALCSGMEKCNSVVANLAGIPALTFTLPVRNGVTLTGATELSGAAANVRYRIQGSTDLSAWTADVDEVTPAITAGLPATDAGWTYRTFRLPGPVTTVEKTFIRVAVEPAP